MDPQAAQRLIQTQPQKADAQAREWNVFASEHPGVSHFVLKQEFDAWARTHGVSDTSVWFGKEVQDAYFYLRQQHEEQQLEKNGVVDRASVPSGLAGLPFLAMAFLQKPHTLEEDGDFIKIVKKKAEEKLKAIPGIDDNEKIQSKEWIDYRYGSLENPDAPTLYKEAEEVFRKEERFTKRIQRYDKERDKQPAVIHKKLDDDPEITNHRWRIQFHSQALIGLQKKQNSNITKEDEEKILQQVRDFHWNMFVEKFPEKAKAYAEKHEGIKSAISRIEERKKQTAAPKIETKAVIQPTAPKPPISPQISFTQKPTQPPQAAPLRSPSMRPSQRTPSLGGLGRIGNPFSLGSSLARQATLRLLLMLAGPVFMVLLFTFAIVIGIGPATTGEASPEQTGRGVLDYTIPFRDTSILPADPDAAKEAVKREYPLAQLQYWDKIIEQSRANGWNPAFVLALWIEETGASHYTVIRNGGGGGGPPHSIGHLGCAPWEEQTIDESLSCLFGSKNIFSSLTSNQFEKFMCEYGGIAPRTPPCVFETPSFPAKIKKYYSLLVPSGPGAIVEISPPPSSGQIVPVGQGGQRIASIAQQIAGQLLRWDDPRRDYPCDEKNSIRLGRSPSGQYSYHCWSEMTSYNYAGTGNENYFECTEFVRATFIKALGKDPFDNIYTDAGGWASKASSNPNFSVFYKARDLQPGDIIEMPLHMAIVLKADGQEVKIAQAATSDAPTMTFRIDNQGLLDMPTGSSLYCGQAQGCNVSFIRYNQ